MSIPFDPTQSSRAQSLSLLASWLQAHPAQAAQLSTVDRQAILTAIDMFRMQSSRLNPNSTIQTPSASPELQRRVVQLERYIVDQLIPSLLFPSGGLIPLEERSNPSHPQADGRDGNAGIPHPRIPPSHNDALLQLLHSLHQLLDLSTWPALTPPVIKQQQTKHEPNKKRHESVPHPKPAHHDAPAKPRTFLPDPTGILRHLTKHAEHAAAHHTQPSKPMQGRATIPADESPTQSAHQAPGKAPLSGEDWIFRLMSIQTAARHMAAMQMDKPDAAISAQLALAMSKLFSTCGKLQTLSLGMENNLLFTTAMETAKAKIQTYIAETTAILKNTNEGLTPARMDGLVQRAWQEQGWLGSLIASLENPSALGKSTSTHETMRMLEGLTPKPVQPFSPEAIAAQSKAEQPFAAELLQPRSMPELITMVQTHLLKHPLMQAHILLPYPATFSLDVANVRETIKTDNDPKKSNRKKSARLINVGSQIMCLVPPGPVIVGDSFKEGREEEQPCYTQQLSAFLIAATPVTNAQFAAWLNEAISQRQIAMPKPGCIYDLEGHLLALTSEAAPMSQIDCVVEEGEIYFRPQMFRENHPVVHVSWWGARTFCISNGLTLPTEEQWERAAGMLPTAYGHPIKKQRYGCAAEELTPSWANYLAQSKTPTENRTLPVGFFDGERVMTLSGQRIETRRAVSPWGCFDMSGNVREWVAEEYDEAGFFQVTKGGSYGDRPFDLRVAARIPQLAETTDPFTGFRTLLSLNVD